MGGKQIDGAVKLVDSFGRFFGWGHRGGGGNNYDIDRLIKLEEARKEAYMARMEKNEREFSEKMRLITNEISNIKEQNHKIMDEYKKQKEEYQKKELERKAKKELKQKQANEQLINDIKSSRVSILQEIENEFDELKDIYCVTEIEKKIKISDEIEELFLNLFQSENISELFLNIILESIKPFENNKEIIKFYNIQIIGRTGVGKSTLINTLLREKHSPTSFGKVGTLETKEYYSNKFPFIKFIDTRGTELSNFNNIYVVKENTLNYIEERLSEKDPNKTIHCLLYCIQGNRFENIEAEILYELRKKYKDGNLPIIIVYTQSYFQEDYEKMKETINEVLKQNELTQIGERVEDINLVGVVAEKKNKIKPFGLDKLLNYLKLKAKNAFFIANINMIKTLCRSLVDMLLSKTLNNILSNKNSFFNQVNDEKEIIYLTLKNIFLNYVPKEEQNLSQNGEKVLKEIAEKLTLKIDEMQKKKLTEFTSEYSEKVGSEIDKTQFNVINQNLGVKLENIKNFSQFKREGKDDLDNILKIKSIIQELIFLKNYMKKLL